jgi:general stress protein YciG
MSDVSNTNDPGAAKVKVMNIRKGEPHNFADYAPEKVRAAGQRGGSTTLSKHGREHYQEIGRRGGVSLSQTPEGRAKLAEAGRRGGKARAINIARRKAEAAQATQKEQTED